MAKEITLPLKGEVVLWSFQSLEAWEAAQKRGFLVGDGRRVWGPFRDSYRWMKHQMEQRVEGYAGRYPVWAWLNKPSLRQGASAHLNPGKSGVRIQIKVPAEHVLVSNFQAWHCVINKVYLPWDEEDADLYDLLGQADAAPLVSESWERVFDIEKLAEDPGWGGYQAIQGVIETVRLDEVVKVDYFGAK